MTTENYITNINQRYQLGNATEHTFREDLQQLIESLVPEIRATNEPKRQSCGAPDYILTKNDIPVGFIEAKDIGDKDLEGKKKSGNKEQFDRYKASLDNLIFTDYLDFHLYHDGEFVIKIAIAEISEKGIVALPQNFGRFENLIKDFCTHIGQNIKSPKKLAEMMAGKARLLSDVIEKALTSDEDQQEDSTLKEQMTAFKNILIHDITPKGFADVYAQTIAYGMFAARLHDPTLHTFSRQEAAELIPKSNPFLRKLFGYIAGPDIDDRIKWIVENLAEIFLACNVEEILKNYGKSTKMEDPIIHFYETFLAEYDPKLRKARGVWYTPAPVVNFIVRAVDDILKTEFDLPQGLADTSKIKVKRQIPDQNANTANKEIEQETHRVQILDPATGTGTFLAEVIKHVNKKFKGQEGIWSGYVENHLLPRLNGFELLMASYAMAHLQLDLLLKETGYKKTTPPLGHPSKGEERLRVYLTNSLEEEHPDTGTLFANWLSSEANEANHIKRDTPVMCIIGNPPYSGESANKGDWIMSLMEDYKKEPGGKEKLKERNPKWINDDYVKFLRYGQHFIEKNGSGVLAFINPHGFLDNPTFRGMRWNLLKTYDKIYTIDLHGNSKKKETCPDGSPDINVFDIMQGVAITVFVKTGNKKNNDLGKILHHELYGKRDFKYDFLNKNSIQSIDFKELPNLAPMYFMVQKDFEAQKIYSYFFKVDSLFKLNVTGFQTHRDDFATSGSKQKLIARIREFIELDPQPFKTKYNLRETKDWNISEKSKLVDLNNIESNIYKCAYRPFEERYVTIDKAVNDRPRTEITCHYSKEKNLTLLVPKQQSLIGFRHVFISSYISSDCTVSSKSREGVQMFPLYLYPETNGQQSTDLISERTPNLKPEIVKQIAEHLGMRFVAEKNSPPTEGCQSETDGVVVTPPQTKQSKSDGVVDSHAKQPAPNEITHQVTIATINKTPIRRNFVEGLPYNPALRQLAKDKRKAGILSEVLFWQQVHKGKFYDIDFDRQRIIGNYIVDFYVKTLGLVVEVDGSSHDHKQEYDAERQAYLESFGLKVFRCTDRDVKSDMASVMMALENFIIEKYGERTTPPLDSVGVTDSPLGQFSKEKTTPPVGHPSKGGESGGETKGEFAPIDILDYIYAVLHSPSYREKYKEFLKIDFPRVPYPKDKNTFWKLVKLGGKIRQIHLLESPKVEDYITQYPIDGDNVVSKPIFTPSPPLEGCQSETDGVAEKPNNPILGKVYINDKQYFDNVPQVAWEFYIGGYQPAQKWLKDRKERMLEFDDILHYQKIIVALTETDRLMKEIDTIEIE